MRIIRRKRKESQFRQWTEVSDIYTNVRTKVVPERLFITTKPNANLSLFSGGWSDHPETPTLEWWWRLRCSSLGLDKTFDSVDPGVVPYSWADRLMIRSSDGKEKSNKAS